MNKLLEYLNGALKLIQDGEYTKWYLYLITILVFVLSSLLITNNVKQLRTDFKNTEDIIDKKVDSIVQVRLAGMKDEHEFMVTDQTVADVTQIIETMQKTVNADRVFIFLYHNGVETLDGIQFKRATCMFERPASNTEFIGKYGALPISIFYKLNTVKPQVFSTFENKDTYELQSLFGRHYTIIPLHKEDTNGLIGFVALTYIHRRAPLDLDEEAYLDEMTHNIRGLLYNIKKRESKK